MHPETGNLIKDAFRLGITSSPPLFQFLEDNGNQILEHDAGTLLQLRSFIYQVKGSKLETSWDRFGCTLSSILVENGGYSEDEAMILGMLKEIQISRHLGFCSLVTLSRVSRCMAMYGYPVRTEKEFGLTLLHFPPSQKLLMITELGKFNVVAISEMFIRHVLENEVSVIPNGPIYGSVQIPGSKSISNRVLLIAALGEGTCEIHDLLDSDDIRCMRSALSILGVQFKVAQNGESVVVHGTGGELMPPTKELFLNNSGTASRFLTSTVTLVSSNSKPGDGQVTIVLSGNSRMKERPIGPLVTALRANGCQIEYVESEGCLPIQVKNTGLKGGELKIEGKLSSQYVSSILMTAPYARSPLTLQLAEESPISLPYILMTVQLMREFGIDVVVDGVNTFRIPKGIYRNPTMWNIEPDASSATYILALAAITGGEIIVHNLGSNSLQGDANFCSVLELMGCYVEKTHHSILVRGPSSPLSAVSLNMEELTDSFMTVAVLAAVAVGTTCITGIANQRVKECNRIEVMVNELTRIGVACGELADGLWIEGNGTDPSRFQTPAHIKCHDDHRIALSFAVLGSRIPGIVITDKDCTSKTYPGFWDDLRTLQVELCPGSNIRSLSIQKPKRPPIFLVGMRGCGKSTFGKMAAAALGCKYLCMDACLEAGFKTPIRLYVEKHGWPAFRTAELNLLRRLTQSQNLNGTIVVTGGGIVDNPNAVELLSSCKCVVHLHRPLEEIKALLDKDKTRGKLTSELDAIWNIRKPLFEKCSSWEFEIKVENDNWEYPTTQFIQLLEKIGQEKM